MGAVRCRSFSTCRGGTGPTVRCKPGGDLRDRWFGIRHDADGGRIDLVDLLRRDVDVDQPLAVEEVVAEVERRVLRERVADGQDDAGVHERFCRGGMTAVGKHADAKRVVLADDPLAVECGGKRNLEALNERQQLRTCLTAYRSEAEEREHRPVRQQRLAQDVARRGDLRRLRLHRRDVQANVAIVVHRDFVVGQVLRHVDVNRPRPSFKGDVDGLLQHVDRLRRVVEQVRLLGRRREHRLRVGRAVEARALVERPLAAPLERGKAGDRQHGVGVRHRHCKPREQVERARPGGGEADAEAVRVDRVATGHERRGLLVLRDDRADSRRVLQRQHQRGGILAGAPERGIDADSFESPDDGFVHAHLDAPFRRAGEWPGE